MASPRTKKKKRVKMSEEEEDRISRLSDELIHRILSFVEAREAVKTSLLSKRWKFIWTTLPFLDFEFYGDNADKTYFRFIIKFLSKRNHQSNISELTLGIDRLNAKTPPVGSVEKLLKYAIDHHVECMSLSFYSINRSYKLSTFSSHSLKKLDLRIPIDQCAWKLDIWHLPALTTLHLRCSIFFGCELSYSIFKCLPALETLGLYHWDLSNSSGLFHLPRLRNLCLFGGTLPRTIWDFPALSSLELCDAILPDNMSEILSALFNLQYFTLKLRSCHMQQDLFISCPRLVNLDISTTAYETHGFVVFVRSCPTSVVGRADS